MGRGIVESGLYRSERYELEQRTSDPASTSEGEMWIRTDLAPETDQLATLRFDAGATTWDVPIYDVAASTTNVEKVWRVPIGGTIGFIPITDDSPMFSALKFQHNGAAFGAHDALTAFVIPDSVVVHRFDEGSGTDFFDTGTLGTADGTLTGATWHSDADALGDFMIELDGIDDYGSVPQLDVPNLGDVGTWPITVEPRSASSTSFLFGHWDGSSDNRLYLRIEDSTTMRVGIAAGVPTFSHSVTLDTKQRFWLRWDTGSWEVYGAVDGDSVVSELATGTYSGTVTTNDVDWAYGTDPKDLGTSNLDGFLDNSRPDDTFWTVDDMQSDLEAQPWF